VLLRSALLVACAVTFAPERAAAVPYELFVDVETEEELYDLLVAGQLSEASFEALLLLHQTRVDLNLATRQQLYLLPNLDYADVDRILAHREMGEEIRAVGDLVEAGILTAEVADSLRAFVSLREQSTAKGPTSGFVRAQLRWTGRHDRLPPATAIQARVQSAEHLDSAVAGALTRNGVRRPRWDANRRALNVEPESVRFEVPKAYVEWEDTRWEVIVGTYRVGFGQRLTFDVTQQATPNGFFGDYELRRGTELGLRCRRAAGELPATPCPRTPVGRVTPDFTWTNRLTGAGLGVKRLPVGAGWLQAYLWGSYQMHRALAAELVDASGCADPRRDDERGCAAPRVYVRSGDPRAPLPTISHASLPLIVGEWLGGANASYFWNARTHVGVTGYGAVPKWHVEGVILDYQEHASRPFNGAFGAIGVDAEAGFRRQHFFAEVSRSFDRQVGGGGGYGAIARSVTTLTVGELDLSLRYYGSRYANPYARAAAAPDEHDGLRTRDETGFRARATMWLGPRVDLRVLGDGWRNLSSGHVHGLVFTRVDVHISNAWSWASWVEHRSKSRDTLLTVKVGLRPNPRIALSWQLQHRSLDASLTPTRRQHDLAMIFNLSGQPCSALRLRARVRYDFQDLVDNRRLAQTLWGYLDTAVTMRQRDTLRLRYDVRAHLDHRQSTAVRAPNPEHWLSLDYLFRY
jgi:DNA uptake protein ComE-like DNA-binding protein